MLYAQSTEIKRIIETVSHNLMQNSSVKINDYRN